jgi:hypothetical protein
MHCREIANLIDSDRVKDLHFADRVQVRVHLWVCWHCRQLVKQIQWLSRIAREHLPKDVEADPLLEERILKKLSSRLD